MAKAIQNVYYSTIHDNLKYYPAWLPNQQFELGAYGVRQNGVFTRTGNIQDLGIPFKILTSPCTDFSFTSAGVKTSILDISANGNVIPGAATPKCGLKIDFNKGESVFFKISNCKLNTFESLDSVGLAILSLRETGNWNDEWNVIIESVESQRTLIYVTNENEGSVTLELNDKDGTQFLNDLNVKYRSVSRSNVGTYVESDQPLTPLFRLGAVKKYWVSFKTPSFKPLSESGKEPELNGEENFAFENIDL